MHGLEAAAAVRRGRRAEHRQPARDDASARRARSPIRCAAPTAATRSSASSRWPRTAARSRRAIASCSPTSPARSRARWRTSSCTRRPRASRSPTSSPASPTAAPSTTRSPREVERSKRFGAELGLVLIDLDDFKLVNDTYGHPQGDVVLREVARVLRESSREIDHPARYGGEELAAVLPGTDLEGAFNRAERVRERIEALRIPRLDGAGTLTRHGELRGRRRAARRRPTSARSCRPPTARCTKPSAAARTSPSERGRLRRDGTAGRRHP